MTKSMKLIDKGVWIAIIISVFSIIILAIDNSSPANENYEIPIKIVATKDKYIEIELISVPTRLCRSAGGHLITSFLHYNGETFRCPCPRKPLCNDQVYQKIKKIKLSDAIIRIADGKSKRHFIKGMRYCRIVEWNYLSQKDKDLIEVLNKGVDNVEHYLIF